MRRAEVVQYLRAIGQKHLFDETNTQPEFSRNRIRNELLPLLREKFNRDVDSALLRLSSVAAEAQAFIEQQAELLLDRCRVMDTNDVNVRLNCAPLSNSNRHLVREMFVVLWRQNKWPLQDMGFIEWEALAEMAQSEIPAAVRIFPGEISVRRTADEMVLLAKG